MKIELSSESLLTHSTDVLVFGVRAGKFTNDANFQAFDKGWAQALSRAVSLERFVGKSGEALRVLNPGSEGPASVCMIGLGDAKADVDGARLVAHKAGQLGQKFARISIATSSEEDLVEATAESFALGAYRFLTYFTGDRLPKVKLEVGNILVAKKSKALESAKTRGLAIAEAISMARDLVNGPPNDVTPVHLADVAKKISDSESIALKTWDKKALKALGMNLFLAVNLGSAHEPRMIHLSYKPKSAKKNTKRVVFVGKGLTFDSGGLCIKPAGSMIDMKCDMAGGAVTLAIVMAAARLQLPIEVHALVGATENMTGPEAFRPGDIYKSYDGKMVEIINTDAEGRLVLADVLAYAKELEPDVMIDHATLTGACMVALGPWRAGLYANDDGYATKYMKAAKDAGEDFWRLPLDSDLRDSLKSDVADMKHTGDRLGGSITAALFLQEFVGKTKWIHLDIAGPAHLDRPHGLMPKGGTGFGVRTALRFMQGLASSKQ